MLTGDLEEDGEKAFVEHYKNKNFPNVDLYKAGHHGSKTSSSQEFLNQTKPKISIIMAGAGNSYGLPKQEILDRLNNIESKIYRTGENGTITAVSDGNQIKINTKK